MGLAVQDGILDIDKPIKEYGVKPQAIWNASGPDYFNNVTIRHLLAQSSGYGKSCFFNNIEDNTKYILCPKAPRGLLDCNFVHSSVTRNT